MRKILTTLFAVAGVMGLVVSAQAGENCDGMYSTSLDVATEESAPVSTPTEGGTTVATEDTVILPVEGQGGG